MSPVDAACETLNSLRNAAVPYLMGVCLLIPGARAAETGAATAEATKLPWFEDAGIDSGLDFVHDSGARGEFFFPEIMGSGGALFDFDSDGDLDLYLVQGMAVGPELSAAGEQDTNRVERSLPGDRLLRNDLRQSSEAEYQAFFVDVTETSRIPAGGVGMGVAVGDIDSDGHPDLYVANHGPNRLLRNRGDGTFEDVTSESGADDPRWSISAAFFDFDGDGRQDLYVANYVDFSPPRRILCFGNTGARDYCGPDSYSSLSDRLFRNLGDGRFEEVTGSAGMAGQSEASLGVAVVDVDRDGRLDLYVANDRVPNRLWINGGSTFSDEALLRGCAVNSEGQPEASMGVAVADIDDDGDEDLFVTHLTRETNTLYVNDGDGMFTDRTLPSGLGMASWQMTSFGTAWLDYDNDALLDLLVVSGAVTTLQSLFQKRDPYPFHQPNQLFRQHPAGTFTDVTATSGDVFSHSEVSRGAISGDVDNDGDTDIVVTNNNGPARLLRNRGGNRNAWIGIRPAHAANRMDLAGSRARVTSANDLLRWGVSRRSASYASSVDSRILVGLGSHREPVTIDLLTSRGGQRRWNELRAGRYWILPPHEGTTP